MYHRTVPKKSRLRLDAQAQVNSCPIRLTIKIKLPYTNFQSKTRIKDSYCEGTILIGTNGSLFLQH